ncbi:MAG: rhodanese-like domain-containing protein [Rhodospirillales bacterium]|nr:rhodanese-like domain-containing protein [Rhodospirillales bacterium]
MTGQVEEVDPATVKEWLDKGKAVLVDVREVPEYAQEHIAGALLVPLSEFDPQKIPQSPGKKVVMQCGVGQRSHQAAEYLIGQGYQDIVNMSGGIQAWKEAGLPTEGSS